jgi:hypothetical protein
MIDLMIVHHGTDPIVAIVPDNLTRETVSIVSCQPSLAVNILNATNIMANANVPLDMAETIACLQVRGPEAFRTIQDADGFLVCGSLAREEEKRPIRDGDYCECDEGWTGINCNVCQTNKACDAMMPTGKGGVCYQNGEVVVENYQMCDVTNVKIVEILEGRRPQVTFTCNANHTTCDFQCK